MKVRVELSSLRAAVTSAVPHMAKSNTQAGEDGLGVVRLALTGHGLQVSATDRVTLASSLIDADVLDDEADPVDLTPTSIKSLLAVFPAPGKDSFRDEQIQIETSTAESASSTTGTAATTVTFTEVGGLFEGASLTVVEYPAEQFPDVPLALRGLIARQTNDPIPPVVHVTPQLLHRFEPASKAFGFALSLRGIPHGDRGVLLVEAGPQFLGAAMVMFGAEDRLAASASWLDRLPELRVVDPFTDALVWTSSSDELEEDEAGEDQ